ncbi:hypothetical protein [Synoicihabitans lomoniglobus]|uniref:Uncharacterized protein n=1 Tax=Synoicihabitans lomoniglobus TaxID=2909285 RepID=A0AAE9ZUY2_9BACT|nr:hypothetical protein [Opitutaceae bacterium LMO-M01]WED64572.1 hypothetical protein PXH66_19700 [Opitutaceae bacterium LMO-M01]
MGPKLEAALEQLELRNLDGAREIYDEVLNSTAGDRPDVLARISGDLGATGHIDTIPELIAPRYDAERHGPATGINLLQAYLAMRSPESAQHVLDLLFALQKPELEERLWGFSNAIAELMVDRRQSRSGGSGSTHINLVTISKPIWAYGIEQIDGLLPAKSDQTKRIAFGQLSLPGIQDYEKLAAQPEEAIGRFARGFPLWMAETLFFSAQYSAVGVIGIKEQAHYALFPNEWTTDNIRQLIDTAGGTTIDYVVTGSLQEQGGDYQIRLRLWEIKGFRERKAFEATWTPATADQVLADLHQQIRFFFEWKATDGIPYAPTAQPTAWIDTLGASVSTFLADKGVLPREQLAPLPGNLIAPDTDTTALARLTIADRCQRLPLDTELPGLPDTPLVAAARARLGL